MLYLYLALAWRSLKFLLPLSWYWWQPVWEHDPNVFHWKRPEMTIQKLTIDNFFYYWAGIEQFCSTHQVCEFAICLTWLVGKSLYAKKSVSFLSAMQSFSANSFGDSFASMLGLDGWLIEWMWFHEWVNMILMGEVIIGGGGGCGKRALTQMLTCNVQSCNPIFRFE